MKILGLVSLIMMMVFLPKLKLSQQNDKSENFLVGEWTEKSAKDSDFFKVVFFSTGKVNVIRKVNNFVGSYQIEQNDGSTIRGKLITDNAYSFTAILLSPAKMKLTISLKGMQEVKYVEKTKEIVSGIHKIQESGKAENL